MNNIENIREPFYSIEIGTEPELVWIKKLRNILNTDIHNKPLGCKISDTHIKIGDVHLSAFFEAQILFSHAKWIHRFAEWLSKELDAENANYFIVGYETYIEPVLSILRNKRKIDYCIYEEPKYIQRNTMSKARLRYSERMNNKNFDKNRSGKSKTKVVLLCGISSTLSTYKKLKDYFVSELSDQTQEIEYAYYSIIQVLPTTETGNSKFVLNDSGDVLTWNKESKRAYRNEQIAVKFLVDVDCEWQRAKNCKWCFPSNNFLDERPLITTGESSVIPLQMIGFNTRENNEVITYEKTIDLFQKEKGKFKYLDYLYYNHIDRDDHHFQYYIRTGALFNQIMDDKTSQSFLIFCQKIKKQLNLDEKNINIIVTPSHFSNERFSHEINRLVFDNKAHIISFDARKEYRSNFETKYSNYAYVLDQINSIITSSKNNEYIYGINFYFVDDQLITGSTFYKAKSFASSLMRKFSRNDSISSNCKIFSAVITLIDRNSNSTKLNFVNELKSFYSFINIPIPSVRSYGDSCPLCKQIIDAQNISDNCTLDAISKHWERKACYHKEKTIEDAKKLFERSSEIIKKRHFVRFYCECALWERIKDLWDEKSILYVILETIRQEIEHLDVNEKYEYLMSFLKVASRPFLIYRENVKKAVLKLLLLVLNEVLNSEIDPTNIIINTMHNAKQKRYIARSVKSNADSIPTHIDLDKDIIYEQYCLICVLISCLTNIESSYLLNVENVTKLCDFVCDLNSNYITFKKLKFNNGVEMNGFYSTVVNNFKKLICGTSGIEKSKVIEEHLINSFTSKYSELFKVLYLENIRYSSTDESIDKGITDLQNKQSNIILKYEGISDLCKKITGINTCLFYLSYGNDFKNAKIAEMFANTRISTFDSILDKMDYDKKDTKILCDSLNRIGYFEFNYQHFLILLTSQNYESHNDKFVLLLLSFQKPSNENYTVVKKWLIHRKLINKIIDEDIRTGALESAIRAKAAEYVLSTDKTQSHGQSNDINKLFELVYERFEKAKHLKEDSIVTAYQGINLFINRCIGFGATKQIFQEYFDLKNINPQLQPFNSCLQKIDIDKQNEIDDFVDYINIITKKDSEYIGKIKKEVIKKRQPTEQDNQTVIIEFEDSFIQSVKKIQYVPLFINTTGELAKSAFFLIGIIDVFIRNAIEHGPNESKIKISCTFGENALEDQMNDGYKYHNSYSISVINNCAEQENAEEGFTKKFFTQYLLKERDKNTFFRITMNKTEQNMFESKLICIVKEI